MDLHIPTPSSSDNLYELADPDPPGWWHALFDDHPTGLQRVEMADAYAQLHPR